MFIVPTTLCRLELGKMEVKKKRCEDENPGR
jgi:hypothetical protein